MKIRIISVILFAVIIMSVLSGCGTGGDTTELESRVAALEKENEDLRIETDNNTDKKNDLTDPIIEDKTEIDNSKKCALCDNNKTSDSEYCLEHKCLEPNCRKEKITGSNYCFSHKCGANNCNNKKSGSNYCSEHECNKTSCSSQKNSGGNYCSFHTCTASNCKNVKVDHSNYCSEHKCKNSNCSAGKSYGSDYCGSHK